MMSGAIRLTQNASIPELCDSLSRCTRAVLFLAICALIGGAMLTAPAFGNTLWVTGAAAQEGNFGLEVNMEAATTDAAFVRDDNPSGEIVYRAQFWIDRTGGIYMDNDGGTKATRFVTFRAGDQNHDGGTSDVTVFRGIFGRLAVDNVDGPRYTFRLGCRQDGGSFRYIGGIVLGELAKKKWVTIEWKAASSPGANDGICRLYQGNTRNLANPIGERTDLDNDLHQVDYVQLGAVSGFTDNPQDPLTDGPLYYDTFESLRTLLVP